MLIKELVASKYMRKNGLHNITTLHFSSYISLLFNLHRSERQARLEQEQNDMMEKISKIRKTDFDNTRRIERPEEILEVSFTVDFFVYARKNEFWIAV